MRNMSEAQKSSSSTSAHADSLLIEIGCEELPPKSLDELRQALFAAVSEGLVRESIQFNAVDSRSYSSPRRLALLFKEVSARQPDQVLERRGPALSAAFDAAGNPTKAAQGFARSVGKAVNELDTLKTDKGDWLVAKQEAPGKPLEEVIFPLLQQAIRLLPIPRPMRWADHEFSFVRPVHWLVVMHGPRVLPGEFLGHAAGNTTRGHRVHAPGPHALSHADGYLAVLEKAFVYADQVRRREVILQQLLASSDAVRISEALLDEVNNLVEWPAAIACSFDAGFLAVPHEALVASMQDHQRFFPVDTAPGSAVLSNRFIAVANIESADPSKVQEGFERVIRPRLTDARFFLEQDQKKPLADYATGLDGLVFQQKIGSVGDKSRRIAAISRKLADFFALDPSACERAAILAKADLLTQMVGEFPELQGTMGRHYALHSGESNAVCDAIEEHYLPRFAGDRIPPSALGRVVGIADRTDSLVAIFAAGLRPTGNKDPFALRRAALGLLRILAEADVRVSLERLVDIAMGELAQQGVKAGPELAPEVRAFVLDRAKGYFRDLGYGVELIEAAMASTWSDVPDLQARLVALAGFLGEEAGLSLAAANKRIGNILRKSESDVSDIIDAKRLEIEEERVLFDEVEAAAKTLGQHLGAGDYGGSLTLLSKLRPSVDRFFDKVMVMDEDLALRQNRLALLARLKGLFDRIADLSVLA